MASVNREWTPIRCVTWAVEDAADALEPNVEGRLHVLALAGGWPRAVVDVRAGSAAEAATVVRRAVEAGRRPGTLRVPGGTRRRDAGDAADRRPLPVHGRHPAASWVRVWVGV